MTVSGRPPTTPAARVELERQSLEKEMKRLRLKADVDDQHFTVLTNNVYPGLIDCRGYGTNHLDDVNRAVACTGRVEPGDDYLVVWEVPNKKRQTTHCSECALEFPGSIVEEKPDATET